MAQCKYCERRGFFLIVDNIGLCDRCSAEHRDNIVFRCKSLSKFGSSIQSKSNLVLALPKFETAIYECDEIIPFWRKGVYLFDLNPEDYKEKLIVAKDEVINEHIQELIAVARQKWASGKTESSRTSGYVKALDKLNSLMFKLQDTSLIEPAIEEIGRELDDKRFEFTVINIKSSMAKGDKKKAASIAIDAMLAMQHDNTPDEEQAPRLDALRKMIVHLEGTPPF